MFIFGGYSSSPQQHEFYLVNAKPSHLSFSSSSSCSSSNALYRFSFENEKWYLITPHINTELKVGRLVEPQHRFFHSVNSC
jgi:hypothetical protein